MEEQKIASIKLVSGEEIICTLIEMSKDGPYTIVTIKNPARIEHRDRRKKRSYVLVPWLIVGNMGFHDIEISKIITVNELTDEDILDQYKDLFRKKLVPPKPRASKEIGFVGNINEYKKILERIYRDSDSSSKEHRDL